MGNINCHKALWKKFKKKVKQFATSKADTDNFSDEPMNLNTHARKRPYSARNKLEQFTSEESSTSEGVQVKIENCERASYRKKAITTYVLSHGSIQNWRYIALFDVDRLLIESLPYQVDFLSFLPAIFSKKSSFKSEEAVVTFIQMKLIHISSRAFLFFHCFFHQEQKQWSSGNYLQRSEKVKDACTTYLNKQNIFPSDILIVKTDNVLFEGKADTKTVGLITETESQIADTKTAGEIADPKSASQITETKHAAQIRELISLKEVHQTGRQEVQMKVDGLMGILKDGKNEDRYIQQLSEKFKQYKEFEPSVEFIQECIKQHRGGGIQVDAIVSILHETGDSERRENRPIDPICICSHIHCVTCNLEEYSKIRLTEELSIQKVVFANSEAVAAKDDKVMNIVSSLIANSAYMLMLLVRGVTELVINAAADKSCPDSNRLQQMPEENFISLIKSVIDSSLKTKIKLGEKLSLKRSTLIMVDSEKILICPDSNRLQRMPKESFISLMQSNYKSIKLYISIIRNETRRMMTSIDMVVSEAKHLFGLERSWIFFDLLDDGLFHFGPGGDISDFVPDMAESSVRQHVISFFEHMCDLMNRLMTLLLGCPDSNRLQQMPEENFISLLQYVIDSSLKTKIKGGKKLSLKGGTLIMVDSEEFERALGEEIPEDVSDRLRHGEEMVAHKFVDTRLETAQGSERRENRPIHAIYFPSDCRLFIYIPTEYGSCWHQLDMQRAKRTSQRGK